MSTTQSQVRETPHTANDSARPTARRMLVFAHGYPPRQVSGAEAHIARKVAWWRARGHEVRVVAADPQPSSSMPQDVVDPFAQRVHGVDVIRLRFGVADGSRPLRDTFAPAVLSQHVRQQLEEFTPDLVYQISGYLFGLAPLQLATASGIPTVLFASDFWLECQRVTLLRPDGSVCPGARSVADCAACRLTARRVAGRAGARVQRQLWHGATNVINRTPPVVADRLGAAAFRERHEKIAETLARVDLVVVNSSFLAERLSNMGVPSERVLAIRQGIDGAEFAGIQPHMKLANTGLRVLYLGQLSRHKGVDLLIEAVTRLAAEGERLSLDLHGPATDAEFADELLGLDHPAVTVGRVLSRAQLEAALTAHDVLAVPSRWYDNSPNVVLEAFGAGVPVVAANHGGLAGMVRHNVDGLLFRPGDAAALASALRTLARDRALLERLRAGISPPHGLDGEMEPEELLLEQLLLARRAESSS